MAVSIDFSKNGIELKIHLPWSAGITVSGAIVTLPVYFYYQLGELSVILLNLTATVVGISAVFWVLSGRKQQDKSDRRATGWLVSSVLFVVFSLASVAFFTRPHFHIVMSDIKIKVASDGSALHTRDQVLKVERDLARMTEKGFRAEGGIKYGNYRRWSIVRLKGSDPSSGSSDGEYTVVFEPNDFAEDCEWLQTRFDPVLTKGTYLRSLERELEGVFPKGRESDWYAVTANYFTERVAVTIDFPDDMAIYSDVTLEQVMRRGEPIDEPKSRVRKASDYQIICEIGPLRPGDEFRIDWRYR